MKVNKSLWTRTTQYITTTLYERYGTLTKQDFDSLMAQLKKKCPADLAPDAFIVDWQATRQSCAGGTAYLTDHGDRNPPELLWTRIRRLLASFCSRFPASG